MRARERARESTVCGKKEKAIRSQSGSQSEEEYKNRPSVRANQLSVYVCWETIH